MKYQLVSHFILVSVCMGSASASDRVQTLAFEPEDSARSRTVPVKIYMPPAESAVAAQQPLQPTTQSADASSPGLPVVLFSHGLGGSRDNNRYLGEFWAANGYVAVFMQHAGSDQEVWKAASFRERLSSLKKAANAKSSRDRFQDVPFVIDQLERWNDAKGHPLHAKLDLSRIGLCGHSYGAVTTLALAGRNFPLQPSYADSRIKAFLPMSPQKGKLGSARQAFGKIDKPILCMTGTKDRSPIDPSITASSRQEVYAALPKGDKYQLVLDGAEHHAFGDNRSLRARNRNPSHHPAIQKISLKFWDAYLKDDAEAKQWLCTQQPVSQTGLGSHDKWEWK